MNNTRRPQNIGGKKKFWSALVHSLDFSGIPPHLHWSTHRIKLQFPYNDILYVGLRIEENQWEPCYNPQHLLEHKMFFFLFNILKHYNAECAAEAHLMWADEGQRQVQLHTYILYICINKTHQSWLDGGDGRKFESLKLKKKKKNSMWKTLQHMPLIVKSKRKQKKLLKQEIQLSIFFFCV